MKQKLLLKTMLLLFALIAGSSSVWADTATITFASQTSGTSDGSTAYTTSNFVSSGIASSSAAFGTITCSATEKCYSGKTGYGLKAGGSSAAGSFTIAFSTPLTNVTQITLNRASYNTSKTATITVKNGSTILGSASTSSSNLDFADMDISGLSISSLAGLTVETNKYCYIKSITITYSSAGTTAAPSITGETPFLDNTTVTITNNASADGAAIYYTLNGDDPTTTTSATCFAYTAPFSINATTTVKAIAKKASDTNASSVVSKTFTKATPLANIAALTANTETGTYYVTLDDAVVTFASGNYAYIQDVSGAVAMYKSGHGLTAGDVLSGTATVAYQKKNSNPQITNLSGVTPTTGGVAPSPTEVAQSAWAYTFNNVLSQYFKITNATITKSNDKYYVDLNGENVQLYKIGTALSELNLSKKFSITGFPTLYNDTKELQIFVDPEQEASTEPTINADDVTIEADATSGEIAYTIDNPTGATLTAAITTGTWISNIGYAAGKVTFTATANTGVKRTATITLSYTGATDKVVTITQKTYAIASLPFAFDGGVADVETTPGLTQTGLGTDYGSSPKLKFDGNGDEVILRTNDNPGTLTFDIKGNSFSGGTFKVQASSDGINYTDLKVYTSLEGSKTTEYFILGSTVRYIKWVYTNKSSGNVALGNINLSAYSSTSISIIPAKEYTTLTCPSALDFTGLSLEAYIATGVSGGYVQMTQVNKVPANTGLVLKATSTGSPIDVPVLTGDADDVSTNKMVGSATATTAVAANAGYILKDGVFQPSSGGDLPAGKAYLNIPYSASAPVLNLNFGEGNTTSVSDVRSKIEEGRGEFYNLNGQRVAQPAKGLYIVNGKKYVVK